MFAVGVSEIWEILPLELHVLWMINGEIRTIVRARHDGAFDLIAEQVDSISSCNHLHELLNEKLWNGKCKRGIS